MFFPTPQMSTATHSNFQTPTGVNSPAQQRVQAEAGASFDDACKFLHMANRESSLDELCEGIVERYYKLYPDADAIDVERVQDANQNDLDPDFVVGDVFSDYSTVLVLTRQSAISELRVDKRRKRKTSSIWVQRRESGQLGESLPKRMRSSSARITSPAVHRRQASLELVDHHHPETVDESEGSDGEENATVSLIPLPPPRGNSYINTDPEKAPSPDSSDRRVSRGFSPERHASQGAPPFRPMDLAQQRDTQDDEEQRREEVARLALQDLHRHAWAEANNGIVIPESQDADAENGQHPEAGTGNGASLEHPDEQVISSQVVSSQVTNASDEPLQSSPAMRAALNKERTSAPSSARVPTALSKKTKEEVVKAGDGAGQTKKRGRPKKSKDVVDDGNAGANAVEKAVDNTAETAAEKSEEKTKEKANGDKASVEPKKRGRPRKSDEEKAATKAARDAKKAAEKVETPAKKRGRPRKSPEKADQPDQAQKEGEAQAQSQAEKDSTAQEKTTTDPQRALTTNPATDATPVKTPKKRDRPPKALPGVEPPAAEPKDKVAPPKKPENKPPKDKPTDKNVNGSITNGTANGKASGKPVPASPQKPQKMYNIPVDSDDDSDDSESDDIVPSTAPPSSQPPSSIPTSQPISSLGPADTIVSQPERVVSDSDSDSDSDDSDDSDSDSDSDSGRSSPEPVKKPRAVKAPSMTKSPNAKTPKPAQKPAQKPVPKPAPQPTTQSAPTTPAKDAQPSEQKKGLAGVSKLSSLASKGIPEVNERTSAMRSSLSQPVSAPKPSQPESESESESDDDSDSDGSNSDSGSEDSIPVAKRAGAASTKKKSGLGGLFKDFRRKAGL